MNKLLVSALMSLLFLTSTASTTSFQGKSSVGGFYELENSGREVFNFNVGWRFHKGEIKGAEQIDFNDNNWDVISTPHTPELVPAEASGGRNYQGIVWYRKHFIVDKNLEGKRVNIYFEAVMGKSKVYVNGKFVKEYLGGFLPFSVELSGLGVKAGEKCVIALMADNSDDVTYPPGKAQDVLDFSYHGGIYRDVWMIATSPIYVTDATKADKVAGGGVFIHFDEISEQKAVIYVDTDVKNSSNGKHTLKIETSVTDIKGNIVKKTLGKLTLNAGESKQIAQKLDIINPNLWHPDSPYLYVVNTKIIDEKGKVIDGVATRVGIRNIVLDGKTGLIINGKPFREQLMGVNHHQDFAYVGNAMPNSQQWRDVKLLRDGGSRIIRAAHYPQDPAFMDACDELGMFMIVATPGWQFWNKNKTFAEFIYKDIRSMIRRDRNHPSVIIWEPILNETRFPIEFSLNALDITKQEYPYPGRYAAGDGNSLGVKDNYDVVYGFPVEQGKYKQAMFTREFSDNVDSWYAHNANNRAARAWGEHSMLIHTRHMASAYDNMYETTGQHFGGTQWHSFDHQRGYHPDPYWGGIMDCFRQAKYSYYLFKSQISPELKIEGVETGPMVFIAHEMTPFSDSSVMVLSNCDSVRLTVYGKTIYTKKVEKGEKGMPYAPVIFENAYDFEQLRLATRKKTSNLTFVAEGIISGKVVCSTKKQASERSTKLRLSIDHVGQNLVADGSDFAVVIAEVIDDNGYVRRLAKERILFSIEGEGEIIGGELIGANPREVEFGTAPVLIRSTTKAGKIKVNARVVFEGANAPKSTSLEFESIPSQRKLVFSDTPQIKNEAQSSNKIFKETITREALLEVEKQQDEFGEKLK